MSQSFFEWLNANHPEALAPVSQPLTTSPYSRWLSENAPIHFGQPHNLLLAGIPFEGPLALWHASIHFRGVAGVYVIQGDTPVGRQCLDVGQSRDIGERLLRHERRDLWYSHVSGTTESIRVMVHHESSELDRLSIERFVRKRFAPPCGDR